MSRSTYYEQLYKCKVCDIVQKHYVWSDNIEHTVHCCSGKMDCRSIISVEDIYNESINTAPAVGKMTSGQIKKDRTKRATEHFKKEVFPTINKKDKGYFAKKHNLKT